VTSSFGETLTELGDPCEQLADVRAQLLTGVSATEKNPGCTTKVRRLGTAPDSTPSSSSRNEGGRSPPLVVNSKTIALKLENPHVRVLEATIKPGDKEKTHSHPAYVIYVIAGGKFRNHAADGTVTDGEFKTGDVIYRDPVTHWAENIGNTTIRLILVELKS